MAVDVVTEIVIDRPRAEVAAYAGDPDNVTEWYQNISAVEWHTPRPVEVGTRVAFVATFLGRRLEYTYEVRELVPGTRPLMAGALRRANRLDLAALKAILEQRGVHAP